NLRSNWSQTSCNLGYAIFAARIDTLRHIAWNVWPFAWNVWPYTNLGGLRDIVCCGGSTHLRTECRRSRMVEYRALSNRCSFCRRTLTPCTRSVGHDKDLKPPCDDLSRSNLLWALCLSSTRSTSRGAKSFLVRNEIRYGVVCVRVVFLDARN